jgi:cytochrome c oxidase cbb3-type subunit 2
MPAYSWLAERTVDAENIVVKLKRLRMLGDPYADEDIEGAAAAVEGRTELEALIAYLQGLGTAIGQRR